MTAPPDLAALEAVADRLTRRIYQGGDDEIVREGLPHLLAEVRRLRGEAEGARVAGLREAAQACDEIAADIKQRIDAAEERRDWRPLQDMEARRYGVVDAAACIRALASAEGVGEVGR